MVSRSAAVGPAVLFAALLAAPAGASHCDGGCYGPVPTLGPTGERVPLDGVLVFPISGGPAEVAFKHFSVTVRDVEGAVVAGDLELPEGFAVAVWRPGAPWVAGARHTVVSSLDVGAMVSELHGIDPDDCIAREIVQEVKVDTQLLPPPIAPPVLVETNHVIDEQRKLTSLVCCDGAFPREDMPQGHCPEPNVVRISTGACASLRATGRLEIKYAVDARTLPATVAGNLATRIVDRWHRQTTPLDASTSLDEPDCLRFEVVDLARGELFVEERCHGEGLADQLGEFELDPTAELAAACSGEPYVCEVNFSEWDETRCRPWPEQQAVEDGCSCRSDVPPAAFAFLALMLGIGRRRRRPLRRACDQGATGGLRASVAARAARSRSASRPSG